MVFVKNNTVYEFHGCFWHGCPKCFPNRNDINPKSKKYIKNYMKIHY